MATTGFAVALTSPASAFGLRAGSDFYAGYINSFGDVIREGQLYWARYKTRESDGYAPVYVLRMYSREGGDEHDVMADILWCVNGSLVEENGMQSTEPDAPEFLLAEELDVWTVADGWGATIPALDLEAIVHADLIWRADGSDPGVRQPLKNDDCVRIAGVAKVHKRSKKLIAPVDKLVPFGPSIRALLSDEMRELMQPITEPAPWDCISPRAGIGPTVPFGSLLATGGAAGQTKVLMGAKAVAGLVWALKLETEPGAPPELVIPELGPGGRVRFEWRAVPPAQVPEASRLLQQPARERAWCGLLSREVILVKGEVGELDLEQRRGEPALLAAPALVPLLNLTLPTEILYTMELICEEGALAALPPPNFRDRLIAIKELFAPLGTPPRLGPALLLTSYAVPSCRASVPAQPRDRVARAGVQTEKAVQRMLQVEVVKQTSGKEASTKLTNARIVITNITLKKVTKLDVWEHTLGFDT